MPFLLCACKIAKHKWPGPMRQCCREMTFEIQMYQRLHQHSGELNRRQIHCNDLLWHLEHLMFLRRIELSSRERSARRCRSMFLKFASSICRVCLGPGATVALFEESGNDEKFKSATQLEIFEEDGLPTSLCEACSVRLNSAYEFQQQSIASDERLRSFVSTMNTKFATEIGTLHQSQSSISAGSGESSTKKPDEKQSTVEENESHEYTEFDTNQISSVTKFEIHQTPSATEDEEEIVQQNSENDKIDCSDVVAVAYGYIEAVEEVSPDESDNKRPVYIDDPSLRESNNEEEVVTDEASTPIISDSNVCGVCYKSFSSRTNLTRHILSHSEVKPYKCPVCQGTFTQHGSLKQHMLKHTGEKPHTCPTCGKGFTRKRLLRMHERIHTGEKPYQCEICNLFFTVKEGLRRHNLRKHMNLVAEVYTCTICNKKLHSKYTFRNHMFLHSRDALKKYSCKICHKSFATKNLRQQHVCLYTKTNTRLPANVIAEEEVEVVGVIDSIKEENDLTWICESCGKIFADREALVHHYKVDHRIDIEVQVE